MYALELQQLKKTYPNGVEALKGVDLQVAKGDFFALLGANGAGKSTTIGTIATLVRKTSGKIFIEEYDLDVHPELAKSSLGLVPQEFNLNIFENPEQTLSNCAGYYGIRRKQARFQAENLLHRLGLWSKRHTIVRHLSGGMKRRLMIARALMHQPKLLILDEPTAGVDIEIRRSVWEFLKETNEQGTTIILTTHYLEEAEQLCKNVAIIHQGTIIENTSIQALLKTLPLETIVFTTSHPIDYLPNLEPFKANLIDAYNFELSVANHQSLNEVFAVLTQAHINITTFRNKANRLEELFLGLINDAS